VEVDESKEVLLETSVHTAHGRKTTDHGAHSVVSLWVVSQRGVVLIRPAGE